MSTKAKRICIVPGCSKVRYMRGNCCSCYFEARRAIEAGEITEAKLIERKLMLAKARTGPKPKSAMSKLIRKPVASK